MTPDQIRMFTLIDYALMSFLSIALFPHMILPYKKEAWLLNSPFKSWLFCFIAMSVCRLLTGPHLILHSILEFIPIFWYYLYVFDCTFTKKVVVFSAMSLTGSIVDLSSAALFYLFYPNFSFEEIARKSATYIMIYPVPILLLSIFIFAEVIGYRLFQIRSRTVKRLHFFHFLPFLLLVIYQLFHLLFYLQKLGTPTFENAARGTAIVIFNVLLDCLLFNGLNSALSVFELNEKLGTLYASAELEKQYHSQLFAHTQEMQDMTTQFKKQLITLRQNIQKPEAIQLIDSILEEVHHD